MKKTVVSVFHMACFPLSRPVRSHARDRNNIRGPEISLAVTTMSFDVGFCGRDCAVSAIDPSKFEVEVSFSSAVARSMAFPAGKAAV